jgi:hypothetical protein
LQSFFRFAGKCLCGGGGDDDLDYLV